MENHTEICSNICWGQKGYDGSCCQIEDRDYIIGPHDDVQPFLNRLSKKFGREVKFKEVFYTFEEGYRLFPTKETWKNPNSFPAMKVDLEKKRKPCIFYNTTLKSCSVYDIRPNTCRTYLCPYLKEHLGKTDE